MTTRLIAALRSVQLHVIPLFIEQTLVNAKFLRERNNVAATLQPFHSHLTKRLRISAHSSLPRHLKPLSLHSVPIEVVSIEGGSLYLG
jgi:hypothetical protein